MMTTLERLSRILVQRYHLEPGRLTAERPLNSLGLDSLGKIEMLFLIEEEFHVSLPNDAGAFSTLGEAAKYIEGLIANQRPPSRPRPEPPGRIK